MASIKDVAKRAGVSISTVSRYINQSAYVDEQKAEAIQEAMDHYQYAPSQFGRGLVKQKTDLIGFYVAFSYTSVFDSDYYTELLKGMETALRDKDYSIVILNEKSDYVQDPNKLPRYMEFLRQKKIDGLILSGITNRMIRQKTFNEIIDKGFPMVYIGQKTHELGMNVYAQFDIYRSEMVLELYRHGHRKILMFFDAMHERYRKAVEDRIHKAAPDINLHTAMLESNRFQSEFADVMQKYIIDKGCTAVVSTAMASTILIYGWCSEHGIRIPENLSIISVESRAGDGEKLIPPVSAFYTQTTAMGENAAELVVKAIEHEDIANRSIELPAVYVPRKSIADYHPEE